MLAYFQSQTVKLLVQKFQNLTSKITSKSSKITHFFFDQHLKDFAEFLKFAGLPNEILLHVAICVTGCWNKKVAQLFLKLP